MPDVGHADIAAQQHTPPTSLLAAMTTQPSRRQFLNTCTAAGAAMAAGPLGSALDAQPQSPRNLSVLPTNKPIIAPADFEYLGLFRLPADPNGTRFGWSWGAMTARKVGPDLRFFIAGAAPDNDPVYEISYPGHSLAFDTSPRATLVRAWGDIYQGKKLAYRPNERVTRGLLWHQDRLWWSYGDIYNASSSSWDPSVGCTILNDSNGTLAAHGPWRTQEHSQRTRGYFVETPGWFASSFTSGQTLAIGAPITSGNAQSPWGAMLSSIPSISPGAPPDPLQTTGYHSQERWSLPCKRLIAHDINHPQARDANYRRCGWNQLYDCAAGATLTNGTPFFTDIDTMTSTVWIDLPDKHGVVFFGQLATKLDGFNYVNDTLPHVWYGMDTCCHGQNGRPLWEATGPGTPTSVPHIWIYNPLDFGRVAEGRTNPWSLTPTSVTPAYRLGGVDKSTGLYHFGGAHFDQSLRLLFVVTNFNDWTTNRYEGRPVIRVFRVKP